MVFLYNKIKTLVPKLGDKKRIIELSSIMTLFSGKKGTFGGYNDWKNSANTCASWK